MTNEFMINQMISNIKSNDIDSLRVQLKKNSSNVEATDKNNSALIHHAVINKKKEILRLLFEHNVDINKRDGQGNTALHLACTENLKDYALMLLMEKADYHMENDKK